MFRAFRRANGRRGYRLTAVFGRFILFGLVALVTLAGSARAQTDDSGFLVVTIGSDETIREVAEQIPERSRPLAGDPPHLGDRVDRRPQAGHGAPHPGQRDHVRQPGAGRVSSARSRRRTSPAPRSSRRTRSGARSISTNRRWRSGSSVSGSRPGTSPRLPSPRRPRPSRCPNGTGTLPPKRWSPTGTATSRASGPRTWRGATFSSVRS